MAVSEKVAQADREYAEWQKNRRPLVHLLRKSKGNPNHGYHGHFASAPEYSIYPQPMNASMLLPACNNPDDKAEQKKYINLFLAEFGGSIDKAVTFTDVTGKKLRISSRMLKDRSTGKYKIFKNGRERYLLMLASALKNPTEIWDDVTSRRGKATPVRRYAATYQIGNERISGVIVFDLMGGQWEGTTAHQRRNPDSVRTGNLVYTAEGIKKAACYTNPVARYPDCAMRMPGRTSGLNKTISKPANEINKSVRRRNHLPAIASYSDHFSVGVELNAGSQIADSTSFFKSIDNTSSLQDKRCINTDSHNNLQKQNVPSARVKPGQQNDIADASRKREPQLRPANHIRKSIEHMPMLMKSRKLDGSSHKSYQQYPWRTGTVTQ